MRADNQIYRIGYRLLGLLAIVCLFSVQNIQAQSYVQLADASGLKTSAADLAALTQAADDLISILPDDIKDQFAVYDFGFYVHNEVFDGYGYPEIFEDVKAGLDQPYYLIFGKQSDDKGIYTKIWVDVKLPETGFGGCIKSNEDLEAYLSQIVNGLESPYEYASFEIEAMNALTIGMNCEICDNGVDDDGDGFADCEDLDCIYKIIPSGFASSDPSCPDLTDVAACLGQYKDFYADNGILGRDQAIEFCNTCRPTEPGDKEGECFTTECVLLGGPVSNIPEELTWVYHLGFSFSNCNGETVSSEAGWYLEGRYPVLPTISQIVTYLAQAEDPTFPKDAIFECQMGIVHDLLNNVPISENWFDKAHNNEFNQQAANFVFSYCAFRNSQIANFDFFDETVWSHYGEYRTVDPGFNYFVQTGNGSDQNVNAEVEFVANANLTHEIVNGLIMGSYIYGTGPELIVFEPGHEISDTMRNSSRFAKAVIKWKQLSLDDRLKPYLWPVISSGEVVYDPFRIKEYVVLLGSFIIYFDPTDTENIYNVTIFNQTSASSGDYFKELLKFIFEDEKYRTKSLKRDVDTIDPQPYTTVGQKIIILNVDISQY